MDGDWWAIILMFGPTSFAVSPVNSGLGHTDYRLDLYNNIGELDSSITDFENLSYTKIVNSPGILQFRLRGDHQVLERIQDKWEARVYRRPRGLEWDLDFVGIFRNEQWNYGEKPIFVGTCFGIMSMLEWRHILYYANTLDFSKFIGDPAETIMKRIVDYNAASNATVANGRKREGAISGLSVEVDLARGNTLDHYCAWDNVLEAVQEVADIGGGDFDVVFGLTGDHEFRFYPGQLGLDKRGIVLFSMERGNMGNPQYNYTRNPEKTVAIVGGEGQEGLRNIEIVLGVNFSATNDTELFVDARDIEYNELTALQDRGYQKLYEVQAREIFIFDVLQTPSTRYGVDYNLGDLVNSLNPFNQQEYDQKIEAVTIGFETDGKEAIKIGIRTP